MSDMQLLTQRLDDIERRMGQPLFGIDMAGMTGLRPDQIAPTLNSGRTAVLISGNASLEEDIQDIISGAATFTDLTLTGNLTVGGNTALGNAITDTTTILGITKITGSGGVVLRLVGRDNGTVDEAGLEFYHNDGTTLHGYIEGASTAMKFYGGSSLALTLTGANGQFAGTLGVTGAATFTSTIQVDGNATLGNANTDAHTLNGITKCIGNAGVGLRIIGRDNGTVDDAYIEFYHNDQTTLHGFIEASSTKMKMYTGASTLSQTWDGANSSIAGTLTLDGGALIYSDVDFGIKATADTKDLYLCGGSALSSGNGSYIALFGNTHASNPGQIDISAGNVSTGRIMMTVGNAKNSQFTDSGTVATDGTILLEDIAVNRGMMIVFSSNSNTPAIIYFNATDDNPSIISDPGSFWSTTKDTASKYNIYRRAGDSKTEIQNKKTGTAFRIFHVGT